MNWCSVFRKCRLASIYALHHRQLLAPTIPTEADAASIALPVRQLHRCCPKTYLDAKADLHRIRLGSHLGRQRVTSMTDQRHNRARYVVGPDGSALTVADLPPRDTKRWVIRRKAELVAAVRGGLLSLEEACERYTLTVDEFLSWQRSIDRHGLPGLRTTRVQDYRE